MFTIVSDIQLPGRFSKTSRQIDIYISGIIAGSFYQKIIDTKYYNKLIDVKVVEEFIGMLNDLDCTSGMIISNKGFTKSAISRAINNPNYLDIDILSFNELSLSNEAKTVMGWTANTAVYINAPLGWTADLNVQNTQCRVFLHSLRYRNKEEAMDNREYIYCIEESKANYRDYKELSEEQVKRKQSEIPAPIKHHYSTWRKSSTQSYILRTMYIEGSSSIETTIFLETEEDIFCLILVSPLVLMKTNFPKLIHSANTIMLLKKEK